MIVHDWENRNMCSTGSPKACEIFIATSSDGE